LAALKDPIIYKI
jgi:phage regulator Rha-like protein